MVKILINTKRGLEYINIKKVKGSDHHVIIRPKGRIYSKPIESTGRLIVKKKLQYRKRVPKKKFERIVRKKRPLKIEKVFKKGIAKIVISDILNKSTSEINNQYKPLFRKVLQSKGLGDFAQESILNSMILEENVQKINWRFEIRADVYDPNGNRIMNMTKGTGGDLMTLKKNMTKGIWRGASVDYDIDLGNGYVFKMLQKGNVDRVDVTVIFRS